MAEAIFSYNGTNTTIQCNKEEKMKDIIDKFANKTQIDIKSLGFIYGGDRLKEELKFKDLISEPNNNRINIVAFSLNENKENKSLVKSKYIICPECKENCKIQLENCKVTLYDCKNSHENCINLIGDFENNQNIDESKIICGICKENNKSESFNKSFFICNSCNTNLCTICNSKHDKTHKIINYEQKDYICINHNKFFISYCEDCNKDMCILCESEHNNHKIISYGKIIPDIEKLKNKNKELDNVINKTKNNINEIINKLYKIINNLDLYHQVNKRIYEDFINNIEYNNINHNLLYNINEFNKNNENIIKELNEIDYNIQTIDKFNNLLYTKNKVKANEISIIYKIDKKEMRLFGNNFVKNNKNNCSIIYNNKEYPLKSIFDKKMINNHDNKLKIKLVFKNTITNMSCMFRDCKNLESISDISNLDTKNITDISFLFYKCSSLEFLPDISNWNTNNIINLHGLFYGCSSLKSLPDISKWNTENVKDMSSLFCGCKLLKEIPDISKWNTSKVEKIYMMFGDTEVGGCSSLTSLPDISKWNTQNVEDMSYLFCNCSSLTSITCISKWNTQNVKDINYLFYNCYSLESVPDVSNIKNPELKLDNIFEGCNKLLKIPNK